MKCRKQSAAPGGCTTGSGPAGRLHAGFSIIELMMSIVLLGIAMALAVPSYREMVEKRQLTNGAEQVFAFVNSAQSESIKQNRILTVSYTRNDSDQWCVGAVLGATACDCMQTNSAAADYCAINSMPWIIDNTHAGNHNLIQSMTGDGAYSFDPVRGLLLPNSDATDDTLVVEMRSDSEDYRLELSVSRTGQVLMCSKDDSHRVPGYAVCPQPAAEEEISEAASEEVS